MLCDICRGAVLTIEEARNPVVLIEEKDGARTRTAYHCCEICLRRKLEAGAVEAAGERTRT